MAGMGRATRGVQPTQGKKARRGKENGAVECVGRKTQGGWEGEQKGSRMVPNEGRQVTRGWR